MCFAPKIPDPKPAPPPPDLSAARKEGVNEQRRALANNRGRRSTILSRVSDAAFSSIGTKKKLGSE